MNFNKIKYLVFVIIIFSACKNTEYTTKGLQIIRIKNAPKNKPYLYQNKKTTLIGGLFTKDERQAVIQRLNSQLDDSSKVNENKSILFFKTIKNPPVFDTGYASISAKNMQASMYHLGYYKATAKYDTSISGRRVTAQYTVTAGKPTLIDTIAYRLKIPELQQIALSSINEANIVKNTPVTKIGVQAEINRLVDSFRNNGYYKFTPEELRVRGDSSIAALTTISDDPFEQLRLLEESQKKRDSPTVKLALVLNKPADTTKLNKYYINKIYILSDYRPNDLFSDTIKTAVFNSKFFIERYHNPLFKTALFNRSITLRSGDVYRQRDYINTINNLTKLAVWQSINIRLEENLDYADKIDIVIELITSKKYSPAISLESSYAGNGNASGNNIGGNLFGISLNLALTNKNVGREAIRMTHNLKFGIELNNKSKTASDNIINSNEVSYVNNTSIPKIPKIFGLKRTLSKNGFKNGESFINTSISHNTRFDNFSLNAVSFNAGIAANNKKNNRFNVRFFAEYNYLYDESIEFLNRLDANPFLKYSYNTAFVGGLAASFSTIFKPKRTAKNVQVENSFKANIESSFLPILKQTLRRYVKLDVEYKQTRKYKADREIGYRIFVGAGKPLANETTLPFFKQFVGGGSNSMRGWPVRGIGLGGQKLTPRAENIFNDRTGDFQLETNIEYRHIIAKLIPGFVILKGAVFADIGNVWNLKRTAAIGIDDAAIFQLKNAWKQLGMSAGYGFRLDITNLVIRADFSFRLKRPETSDVNNGWKIPSVGLNEVFKKLFSNTEEARDWRYENFNLTFGINYPF